MQTNEQLKDLAQLHDVAARFAADVVIIGAAALLRFVDLPHFTSDIDLAVALDLEDFFAFSTELRALGWRQEKDREHRWHGPNDSLFDLVPAGPKLRASGQIIWPESQFAMSLIGFDHLFTRSETISFGSGIPCKVAPPAVVALLKIVAFTENPHRRRKDLDHLKLLLRCYEEQSDRIFGDDVFAAELEDVEYAAAFLLGGDIGAFTTEEDSAIVNDFLKKQLLSTEDLAELDRDDPRQREAYRFQLQLAAFKTGFSVCGSCGNGSPSSSGGP